MLSKEVDDAITEEINQHISIMKDYPMAKGNKPPKNDKASKKPKKVKEDK